MRLAYFPAVAALCLAVPGFSQIPLNPTPTRVVGQDSLTISGLTPNLVEGREFDTPLGIALDLSSNPPHVYVADTGNNRVLGWSNASSFTNGQKADIVIGQTDFVTTYDQGPNRGSTPRTTGLYAPVGVVVDSAGNVYVDDCGNNRILRFPKPFSQSSIFPDIVIGQPDFSHNGSNGTAGVTAANTLSLNPGGSPYTAYAAFDAAGNLWAADPGNNRVLRFNKTALAANTSNPSADLVIGQSNFTSSALTNYSTTSLTAIAAPTGVAVDSSGNLFISESFSSELGRILVYASPSQSGQAATRLIGEPSAAQPTTVNASQLGVEPGALAIVNNGLVIADSSNNRLLLYPPVANWTSDTGTQIASQVVGQPDLISGSANEGQPEASSLSLSSPAAMAFSGAELFTADTGNHRVLVMPLSGSTFASATRVLGQDAMNFNTVNLIEGREFRFTTSTVGDSSADAGVAVDLAGATPHLYVADPYNNRVLGYTDARKVRAGDKADIVIGQPDFSHSEINYPSNNASTPNQSGLQAPIGLAVDVHGNLYVADSGNARVLRFPQPFLNPQNLPNADIVLGQSGFTSKITDPSPSTMNTPYGLAFASDYGLLASDVVHNRVLYFPGPSASLQSGMSATAVFGQPDFTTITSGSGNDQLNAPHHISTDAQNRLYVADSGNSRVDIFSGAPSAGADPQAALTLTGITPIGIYVNPTTGEIWEGDYSGVDYHYPNFDNLTLGGSLEPDSLSIAESASVLALTQDAGGGLYVADGSNRVVMHFPGLAAINSANYITDRALSPGTIASIFSLSNLSNFFGSSSYNATSLPIPTTLGSIQVTVNDVLSPIFYAGPNQINFLVPNSAPSSGVATIEVVNSVTGQVLGSSGVAMATVSPGLFTLTATGSGQVAAINQDGTVNGPSHPAPWNSYVAFYGTGLGMVPNAPPDGSAATGATPTAGLPQVVIGAAFVPAANVTYSGLAPGLVGVWQVNVKVPNTVPATTANAPTPVFFLFDSVPTGGPAFGRAVTMWVVNN